MQVCRAARNKINAIGVAIGVDTEGWALARSATYAFEPGEKVLCAVGSAPTQCQFAVLGTPCFRASALANLVFRVLVA